MDVSQRNPLFLRGGHFLTTHTTPGIDPLSRFMPKNLEYFGTCQVQVIPPYNLTVRNLGDTGRRVKRVEQAVKREHWLVLRKFHYVMLSFYLHNGHCGFTE
jgi:hypothetical protein